MQKGLKHGQNSSMITMKAPSGGRTSAMLAWAEVRTSDGQDEMSKQGGNHIMENKPTSFPVEMTYFVRRVTFDGYRIEPRTIDDYELVFVTDGEGWVQLGERTFRVKAGNVIFVRPGVINSFRVDKEPFMVFFGVHFQPLNQEAGPETPIGILPDVFEVSSIHKVESLFRELHKIHRQKGYLAAWRENLLTETILCELCGMVHQNHAPAAQNRIRKVLDHIHENPYRSYSLEELMQIAGIKKTLFLQEFRSVTGTTPNQYVTDQRLEYARELLMGTDASVMQIARQCGFEDVFYFSRCFKKRFHLSPREYRKEI